MILNGETESVEFKQTLRFDTKKNEKNTALEYVVIKTIAGFLNENGGTLVIGVKDKGEAVGLEDDFKTLSKPDTDGFQLHLSQLCRNHIGADLLSHIKITFPQIEGKILCVVKVSKCSRSVITNQKGAKTILYVKATLLAD
jgi:predicted HTH transcriptional regulator